MPQHDCLSVKLPDVLPAVLHADLIEKKALRILNSPGALKEYPSFQTEKPWKKFMVARDRGEPRTVKMDSKSKVICECKGFR